MRGVLARYGLNGLAFTALGPALFWLLYPIGPIAAWAITEATCHAFRFLSFKHVVFPSGRGYQVTIWRYAASATPTAVAGFLMVALLKESLGRILLTAVTSVVVIGLGFCLSQFAYMARGSQRGGRTSGCLEPSRKHQMTSSSAMRPGDAADSEKNKSRAD
jgi:hypothetical protein